MLNKSDQIDQQQLMRVYGALMWSLGKVFRSPEVGVGRGEGGGEVFRSPDVGAGRGRARGRSTPGTIKRKMGTVESCLRAVRMVLEGETELSNDDYLS